MKLKKSFIFVNTLSVLALSVHVQGLHNIAGNFQGILIRCFRITFQSRKK